MKRMICTSHDGRPIAQRFSVYTTLLHSATFIWEVTNWSEEDDPRHTFCGDGWYHWDETESAAHGPYKSFEQAIEKRDEYFHQLNAEYEQIRQDDLEAATHDKR